MVTKAQRMKYRGLIFDFNGVLFWDNHLQLHSWQQFSAKLRGFPLTSAEMAVHVHGRNGQYTLQYLLESSLRPDEVEQLTEQKETIYRHLCLQQKDDFRLSPGAVELLDFLVTNHIPHTIATASAKGNLDFFWDHLDLGKWFELEKVVFDDGRRPGKPAPDIYLQAARNLALAPGECVVVEDSYSGLQAAHAAGVGHIVALGPARTHQQLANVEGVNRVIESLSEIPGEALFL
jgi:beta-phosphoglucomutase-like phosphatase (HAD superfamily)